MASGFFPPDDASAVAVQPTPKVLGTPGYYSDGSLTVPATILDGDFLNGLINEFQLLSTTGGIALSKSAQTMVPNIQAMITIGLGNYVLKAGDTMSGNLILGHNYSGNNATTALQVENGSSSVNVIPAAPASTVNTTVQAGDGVIWYTGGTVNTGGLTIAPYGSGATGGIRLDNTGAATFNRPVTLTSTLTANGVSSFTSTVTITGAATALTPAVNNNSTNIATTAYVIGQAATGLPLVGATSAGVGISLTYARQDHVHPNQTIAHTGDVTGSGTTSIPLTLAASGVTAGTYSKINVNTKGLVTYGTTIAYGDIIGALGFTPVQQGGGAGQGTNKVYLGWNGAAPSIQIDATNEGAIAMLGTNQVFTNYNTFNAYTWLTGAATVSGTLTTGPINAGGAINGTVCNFTTVNSINGNVVANNGRLRASYGYRGSGDSAAGVIGSDYANSGGVNGYNIFPNGLIIQWLNIGVAGQTSVLLNLPIAFPNYFASIVGSIGWSIPVSGSWSPHIGCQPANNSQFYVSCYSQGTAVEGCNFLAIGY